MKSLYAAIVVVMVAIGAIVMASVPKLLGTDVTTWEILGWYAALLLAWIGVLALITESAK